MPKYLIFNLLLTLLFACNSSSNRIIPEDKLVPILVDLHLADALAVDHSINQQFGRIDSASMYKSVLGKYGYTRDEIEQSLLYYSKNPEKINKIYDHVFSDLSSRSEELKKLNNSIGPSNTTEVYRLLSPIVIIGDTINYPDTLNIKIDSCGTYIITASIQLQKNDSSINPKFSAYFYNSEHPDSSLRQYFNPMLLTKSLLQRDYILISTCTKKELNYIHIEIPKFENKGTQFNKNLKINRLEVRIQKSEPVKK